MALVLRHLGAYQPPEDALAAFSALNSEMLASAGSGVIAVEPLNPHWYASPRHAEFRARATELVDTHFVGSYFFALTGAGIGGLVPFWREVLEQCGIAAAVVNFYEDPGAYARRLGESMGVSGSAAHTLWLGQALEAERASRGGVRTHVTQEALVQDWEGVLARIESELGVTWSAWSSRVRKAIVAELVGQADEVRDVAARRSPAVDDLGRWAQEAQVVLWRWARDGEDERGFARLDELEGLFTEARDFVGAAFDTIVDLGEALRRQREHADALMVRVGELEEKFGAESLIKAEAERDAEAEQALLQEGPLARMEARWADIFRASHHAQEILAEQNVTFQNAVAQLTGDMEAIETKLAESEAEIERFQLSSISQRAETRTAVAEVTGLRKSINEAQDTIKQLRATLDDREKLIEDLRAAALAKVESASNGTMRGGLRLPGSFSPTTLFRAIAPKSRRKVLRHRQLRAIVANSGLFDSKFYASTYPDVVAAGQDLLDHFIRFGGAEGRHPSSGFNSKWYLAEYPDIRGAGLNPLVHYLEHGRDEGRRRRGLADGVISVQADAPPTAMPQSKPTPAPTPPPDVEPQPSELEPTWRPRETGWKGLLSQTFAKREAVLTMKQLSGMDAAQTVTIGGTAVAAPAADGAERAHDRLALFCALRPDVAAATLVAGKGLTAAPPHNLVVEPGFAIDLLADGWFDGPSVLTLRFSGGFEGVVRAFQFDDAKALKCVAEANVGGTEADLVEIRMVNPLGELLVIFCTGDGVLRESLVVPFPSLLRGGLHHGELAVLEAAPGSMASLADYSRALAADLFGWPEGPPAFAISRVLVDLRGASGIEPIFRPDVLYAFAHRFGIAVAALDDSYPPERSQLVATLDQHSVVPMAGRDAVGATLVVASDMLPSIYSMVSRRGLQDLAIARFAVVDSATLKPRADITLPFRLPLLPALQHHDHPAHAPYVVPGEVGKRDIADAVHAPVCPLAVRHYNMLAWQLDPLMPVSPDRDLPLLGGKQRRITAIIDAGPDDAAVVSCLAGLAHQNVSPAIDVILAGWASGRPVPDMDIAVRTFDGRERTRASRLNAAAALADDASLLFLDAGVVLSDPRTVALLQEIAGQPGVASAACALVTENEEEDTARLHSAGYFPTRISLCGEPVFDFDQVDVGIAFPAATFPVVANHLKCCLIDGAAWSSLGGFDARRFPQATFDLDFGNRALAAGLGSYCTTLMRAATDTAVFSGDFSDPIAQRSVRPADWQTMFDNVTVIRELRR